MRKVVKGIGQELLKLLEQNNMELLQKRSPNWGQNRVVNLLIIGVVIVGTMTGCFTRKHPYPYHRCKGYEVKHYNVEQEKGIHVHGRIKVCGTRKIVSFAKIRFVTDSGTVYEATANKKGYYEIKLPRPYFVGKVVAFGNGYSFTAEDMFFGYTNTCELNINLYNNKTYKIFYNEVELLKDDLIFIYNNRKKKDKE